VFVIEDVDTMLEQGFEGTLCEPCLDQAQEGADALAKVFDGYLAQGISREHANELVMRWWIR
jgi:hypothetical protein